MSKKKFYAVAKGRKTGIFASWSECERQVKGFSGAKFKSFATREDAKVFLRNGVDGSTIPNASSPSTISQHMTRPLKGTEDQTTQRKSVPKIQQSAATTQSKQLLVHLHLHITFDGGSRGNPGVAGSGAVLTCRQSSTPMRLEEEGTLKILRWVSSPSTDNEQTSPCTVVQIRDYVGDKETNNVAEYNGLCEGLLAAKQFVEECLARSDVAHKVHLLVQGDSKLIIQQLHSIFKCNKPWLQRYLTKAQTCMDSIQAMEGVSSLDRFFQHIPREVNQHADALANEAMDSKQSWKTQSLRQC